MSKFQLSSKQRDQLLAWDNFILEENGALPATIAALKLGVSTAALYQSANRGWLKFFRIGRDRWYGRKSILRYSEKRATGKNWDFYRASSPRDCSSTGADPFIDPTQFIA